MPGNLTTTAHNNRLFFPQLGSQGRKGNNINVTGTYLEPFPKTLKQSSRLKYKSSFVGFILLFSTGELPAA